LFGGEYIAGPGNWYVPMAGIPSLKLGEAALIHIKLCPCFWELFDTSESQAVKAILFRRLYCLKVDWSVYQDIEVYSFGQNYQHRTSKTSSILFIP
jgi:hypothetical protein